MMSSQNDQGSNAPSGTNQVLEMHHFNSSSGFPNQAANFITYLNSDCFFNMGTQGKEGPSIASQDAKSAFKSYSEKGENEYETENIVVLLYVGDCFAFAI
jgi:hypothetical protein